MTQGALAPCRYFICITNKTHLRRSRRRKPAPRRETRTHAINHEIRAAQVRVVEIGDDKVNEVVSIRDALRMAEDAEMDLIMISPKADPPVTRIQDYSKFAYDLKKSKKAQQAKQHQTTMKELRFGPNTDEHDLEFKMKHAEKFLAEGNKLKTYVHFRGRSIIYKDRGREILDRIAERLEELAVIEQQPTMNGRRMIMILAPKGGAA